MALECLGRYLLGSGKCKINLGSPNETRCIFFKGGLMQTIVLGLNSGLKTVEERTVKKKILIDYLLLHIKQHNMYAIRYWFCEVLCLVNIIGQLYLMNRFTGGEFFSYGLKGSSWQAFSIMSINLFHGLLFDCLQCCRSPMLIKKNGSIRWFLSSLALPSARSTNLARPVL